MKKHTKQQQAALSRISDLYGNADKVREFYQFLDPVLSDFASAGGMVALILVAVSTNSRTIWESETLLDLLVELLDVADDFHKRNPNYKFEQAPWADFRDDEIYYICVGDVRVSIRPN